MRVLFVSAHYPRDISRNVTGAFQRMRIWLDAIEALGGDLEILFFRSTSSAAEPADATAVARQLAESWGVHCTVTLCDRDAVASPVGLLQKLAHRVLTLARPEMFQGYMGKVQREVLTRCISRSPDIVFFHRLNVAGAAMDVPLGKARVVLDLDDVEHRTFAREIVQPPRWRWKPLRYLQVPALWWRERQAIVRSRFAFVCSEADRRYLQRTMGVRNVEVVQNAVARVDDAPLTAEPNVLFIGTYGYSPNVVAAEYLVREVWPRLRRMHSGARLLIAGSHPELIPSFGERPEGVEFLGFVADLNALYRRTRVLCCPIQSGGGTRIKILEAASYGVPIVSTTIGAEGLALEANREIILRDDAEGLARACADLLTDGTRAQRIGAMACTHVRTRYNRNEAIAAAKTFLLKAAAPKAGPRRSASETAP